MAIAASGAVSFSDLRSEFVGGSGAVSFSDLYRGGSNILAKSANNTGVNLAASVPASGTINFTNFRSTAKGFRYTYTAGATNQNASSLFGDDYSVSYPKEIVIDSGVELGATSTAEEALQIDSGASGTITVTNNGTLSGAGGAAGASCGDAFEANVSCTVINNGTIRSGGGGGGSGGNGNQTVTNTVNQGPSGCCNNVYLHRSNGNAEYFYGGANVGAGGCGGNCAWGVTYNGYPATLRCNPPGCGVGSHGIRLTYNTTQSTTGGSGGRGQGYDGAAAAGAAGGTNAGTGGTGGGYGANGNAGANGNVSAGSGGGAAGAAIRNISNVTFTNNGTVQGGQV